jgi:hypothetical protein
VSDAPSAETAEGRRKRRRRIGLVLIGASVLMLFLGNFPLEPYLRGTNFILYWSVCFLFALMALFTAVVDMVAVRRDAERERRRLVEETLRGRKVTREPQHEDGESEE